MSLFTITLILTGMLAVVPVLYRAAVLVERREIGERKRAALLDLTKQLVETDRRRLGDKRAKPVSVLRSIIKGVTDLLAIRV